MKTYQSDICLASCLADPGKEITEHPQIHLLALKSLMGNLRKLLCVTTSEFIRLEVKPADQFADQH